ncbi:MAG: ribbon-helix-helix domain-containing protein [Promethearchaeota archaeon]
MASKTTVAVDQKLRKKIKKLSALLDIPQSAVIEKAITNFEKELISNKNLPKTNAENDSNDKMNNFSKIDNIDSIENIDVSKILEEATKKIWKKFPELEKKQKMLQKGPQTIDDFLINDWITGLED